MLVYKIGCTHPETREGEVHLGARPFPKHKELIKIFGQCWKTARQSKKCHVRYGAIPFSHESPIFVKKGELVERGWEILSLKGEIEVVISPQEMAQIKEGILHEGFMVEVYGKKLFKEKHFHPLKTELKTQIMKHFF